MILLSLYKLGFHDGAISSSVEGSELISACASHLRPIEVNYGFGGGRWLEMPHSCVNKSHLTFQTSTLKDLRSDQDFPKIAGDL